MMPVVYSQSPKFWVQMLEKKFIDGKRTVLAGAIIDTHQNPKEEKSMKTSYISASMHASVLLNKGDSVAVQLVYGWLHAPGNGAGSHMTTFTGFLVEARE